MAEFDPDAHVNLDIAGVGEVYLGRYNSALFLFLGQNAMGEENNLRNHVYLEYEGENDVVGSYIFQCNDMFGRLAAFMMQNKFPVHMNLTSVAECDEDAYQRMLDKAVKENEEDLGDFPPDWADGTTES